jgi:hypothetical protein
MAISENKLYDQHIFKQAHSDLIKTGTSKIGLAEFERRQVAKNVEQRKKEFKERSIRLS